MSKIYKEVYGKDVPQSEPLEGMSQNNAGGFSYAVNDWVRLERFLIIGTEGGTYYVKPRKLTLDNAKAVENCIKEDGKKVVDTIIAISDAGRAMKNDPALFALAMCASFGDNETKRYALENLHKVARIGTHLFMFTDFINDMRGWGRGLRNAVADWYNGKDADRVAYQVAKYQQRGGWSHRDTLRLSHAIPVTPEHDAVFAWATEKDYDEERLPKIIKGLEIAKTINSDKIVDVIGEYGLTREMIPTRYFDSPEVWEALLENMPMTAMVRNLGKMSQVGLLAPMSEASKIVAKRLRDEEYVKKSRIHPFAVYVALSTYIAGHGFRGKLVWSPVPKVLSALESAFYSSFENVESTGKRFYLGLDVSGSMTTPMFILGITPRSASGLMAMVTMRSEEDYVIKGFTGGSWYGNGPQNPDYLTDLALTPEQSIGDVVKTISNLPFGGTDCALPMIDALKKKIPVDVFVIYTDSETWAGKIHPVKALQNYRQKMGIPAKLIVVGMVSNGFSIADPNDAGMLDIVGFDTATPQLISQFATQ